MRRASGSGKHRQVDQSFPTLLLSLLILSNEFRNTLQSPASSSFQTGLSTEVTSKHSESTKFTDFPWISLSSSSSLPYHSTLALIRDSPGGNRNMIRDCSTRLRQTLEVICEGNVKPDVGYMDCCIEACTFKDLRKYCGNGRLFQEAENSHVTPDARQMSVPDQDASESCERKYYCSHRLRNKVKEVCFGNFHNPNSRKSLEQVGKRSTSLNGTPFIRRVPRAAVDDCCHQPCCEEDMRKYCGKGSPPVPIKEPAPVLIQLFKILEEALPKINQNRNDRHGTIEQGDWGRNNAFTSTLPPMMIRLGPRMYD